jgi:hypothetical protein
VKLTPVEYTLPAGWKLDNFCAAVALNFTYYNFCKSNLAVRMTPAQAAGIESSQWTVAELVERCGE